MVDVSLGRICGIFVFISRFCSFVLVRFKSILFFGFEEGFLLDIGSFSSNYVYVNTEEAVRLKMNRHRYFNDV